MTNRADSNTPLRRSVARKRSKRSSPWPWRSTMSESPQRSAVDHLRAKGNEHQGEQEPQRVDAGADQHVSAEHRAKQHTQHHRQGDARFDPAASEVDAGAGRGGNADHEVAGGRGYL